jgi:predicted dehydrogenase
VAWSLLGYPTPTTAFATVHQRMGLAVEEGANALVRFEDGRSAELSVAWAINAPPHAYGVSCRVHGTVGSMDVYTSEGATLYKSGGGGSGGGKEGVKAVLLKGPKVSHYVALMRELRHLTSGKAEKPLEYAKQAVVLAGMVEAMYKSAREGRAVNVKVH